MSSEAENAFETKQRTVTKLDNMPPGALDFDLMFDTFVKSNQRTWAHDRMKTIGASEIFGCMRKAFYMRNGAPRDPDYVEKWGATQRGNLIENNHAVPALKTGAKMFGFTTRFIGEEQETLFTVEGDNSVTPDGLLIGLSRNALELYGIEDIESDCIVVEIKSIDPRVSLAEEKAIHRGQIQMQMGVIREQTEHKPMWGVIVYINASFIDDIEYFFVRYDDNVYNVGKSRAKLILTTKKVTDLIREGKIDGGCKYCMYQGVCSNDQALVIPKDAPKPKRGFTTDAALLEQIDPLVTRYARAASLAKRDATSVETLKQEMVQVMLARGQRSVKGEGYSVSISSQEGRDTYDIEAMRAAGIDVDRFKKQGNPFDVVRVTLNSLDEDAD